MNLFDTLNGHIDSRW